MRLRGFGIYSYRIADPRAFFTQISGTREYYYVNDLEGQLREAIVARMTDIFASSETSFLDMTARQAALSDKILEKMKPPFAALGLELAQFAVENISLPAELEKMLDQRIAMNMVGDVGRYAQFAAAESMPIAAGNSSGVAGVGVGLAAGAAIAQGMATAVKAAPTPAGGAVAPDVKFCMDCGNRMPAGAKFCSRCGMPQ